MERLTVFTPSYNRAHLLPRLFESLKRQSCKDFVWLIVDDGSTDNTRKEVGKWQKEDCGFRIEYIYKENGGMHTAHNTAYANIKTELNVCIDSDDMLPDGAAEKIISFWNERGSDEYAGILGIDSDFDGNTIGTGFPKGLSKTTLGGYYRAGGRGDKKLVLRTEIVKKFPPYPEFDGERLVPLDVLYRMIDSEYELLVLPETLCLVEYQPDGSTNSVFRQYAQSPRGFAYARIVLMRYGTGTLYLFRQAVHYVSSSIFAFDRHFLKKSPKKLLTVLAVPFGAALNIFIRLKNR